MKIEKSPIKISTSFLSHDNLKNLKIGSQLYAKVYERLGNRNAVLNLNGTKVKAEFLNGIPDSDRFNLILEKKVNNTFFLLSGIHIMKTY